MQATEFEQQLTEHGLLMSRAAEAKYAFEMARDAWVSHYQQEPHDGAWNTRNVALCGIWVNALDRFRALERSYASRMAERP